MNSVTPRSADDKYYRSLFESSMDAVFLTVPDGTIVAANPAACRMFGMSEKEVCAAGREGLIDHNDMNHQKFLEERKSAGKARGELIYRRKDGSRFRGDATSVILEGGASAFVIVRDISESKQAEEELRLSQYCINKAGIGIYQTDGTGAIISANEYACESLGYTMEELCTLSVFDIDPEITPERMLEVKKIVGSVTHYSTHRRRDGATFPVEITCNHLDFHGKRCDISFVKDITERKKAEGELLLAHDELERRVAERTEQFQKTAEELRASEERYALAIQGANDGIWDLNLITGEAYHSPRWKSILGYEDDEISGNISEWWSRIHPADYQRVMESCKAYEEGRLTEFRVEHRLRHKDGSYRWVLSRGACLRDSDGKPYRASGSLTDITERKKLEHQLLQSQKMESIGILAGGVAHDFNNLLTAISGYGQILLETIPKDDDLSLDNIRNVLKAADRAAELTRGLLAFSRKQTISPKPVHIDTLISSTGKIIQRIIGEDIEFGTNLPDNNLLIEADPGQIEQVLMNLASNARDAMPDGGYLCITARRAVVEDGSEKLFDLLSPGKYALISVSDTGIGIEKESLGKIFEPFYTTKGVVEGTGLGLSIVHGVIKQHNGSILVSSEPGKGTQVDIYLPLIEGHAEEEYSKPAAPHAAGKETVLVVEDEEIVRAFMQKILGREGYRVILANNGEDGVERFREHDDISLVLSDVIMPRKNGRQMLDEIRRMKPGIKAVFMSGYTADYMRDKGILDDLTEFITKPVNNDDLLRKVRELLDKD
jgi:two-component system, cell cycle sensor histidine kinase and response regulator CckA